MAESNFVDYVKIYCRSGKGGRGSAHMRREKYMYLTVALTVVMAVEEVMLFLGVTVTIGHCFT
jgi:hypothetical protein